MIPLWLFGSYVFCTLALCLAPLAAWIVYSKNRLNWTKFIAAWIGAYYLPLSLLMVIDLIAHREVFRMVRVMLDSFSLR